METLLIILVGSAVVFLLWWVSLEREKEERVLREGEAQERAHRSCVEWEKEFFAEQEAWMNAKKKRLGINVATDTPTGEGEK